MQRALYNTVSQQCSRSVTKAYSNSFSLAIRLMEPAARNSIYSIYAFVRLADEIVDTFHEHDKPFLFNRFVEDTSLALQHKISLNPVINSFQETVHHYDIDRELIDAFLESMKKDLYKVSYDREEYMQYIFGSADVVGLMCLFVFVNGDKEEYKRLKHSAMKLGSAFQKVNFLRDIKNDYELLNRSYFPGVNMEAFTKEDKQKIIAEIENDFDEAYIGIRQLPPQCGIAVYTAYQYYRRLLKKLAHTPASEIMHRRISIPSISKIAILIYSYFRCKLKYT